MDELSSVDTAPFYFGGRMDMGVYRKVRNKVVSIRENSKIYKPYYNHAAGISSKQPPIFNESGQPMELFFIRDMHTAHNPYGNVGKHFLWDRYNWGLDTHFYTHRAMLETMGKPLRKYGMLGESRAIVPKDYLMFEKHKGLEREFDAIFTYDERLLDSLQNAKYYPICAEVWYGRSNPEIIHCNAYAEKDKNISILCSDKQMCELHKVRAEIARCCKRNRLADVMGTLDGGEYVSIDDSLRNYRYSFAIENELSDYFFTERITSCFAAQTIPIYLGASKIDSYFNKDGIIEISLKDIDNIEAVIKKCTKEEYDRRLPAILDNYKRVQSYFNMQDYLYEKLL